MFSPGKIIIKEEGLPERYYMVLCGQGLRAKSLRLPAGNVQLKSETGNRPEVKPEVTSLIKSME